MTDVPSTGWREVYDWAEVPPPYEAWTDAELRIWWPEAEEVVAVGSFPSEVRRRG